MAKRPAPNGNTANECSRVAHKPFALPPVPTTVFHRCCANKLVHFVASLVRYRYQKNPLLKFSCLQLKALN
jgi:hypothetical protein